MPHKTNCFLVFAFMGAGFILSSLQAPLGALAQNRAQPSVEVDMSVLEELGRFDDYRNQVPVAPLQQERRLLGDNVPVPPVKHPQQAVSTMGSYIWAPKPLRKPVLSKNSTSVQKERAARAQVPVKTYEAVPPVAPSPAPAAALAPVPALPSAPPEPVVASEPRVPAAQISGAQDEETVIEAIDGVDKDPEFQRYITTSLPLGAKADSPPVIEPEEKRVMTPDTPLRQTPLAENSENETETVPNPYITSSGHPVPQVKPVFKLALEAMQRRKKQRAAPLPEIENSYQEQKEAYSPPQATTQVAVNAKSIKSDAKAPVKTQYVPSVVSKEVPVPDAKPGAITKKAARAAKRRARNPVPVMPAVPPPYVEEHPLAGSLLDYKQEEKISALKKETGYAERPVIREAPERKEIPPETEKLASVTPAAYTPEDKPSSSSDFVPRPPPANPNDMEYISLPFAPGTADLTEEISRTLNSNVLEPMKENPGLRLQIQAFSSATSRGVSSARRMSLSRALSIRAFLLDQGIPAHRMDVRALGSKTDRQPLDRVDLVFFSAANTAAN